MNIFKSNLEDLKKSLPAKTSKRFVSWVIDFALVAFVGWCIFAVLFQIIKNTDGYTAAEDTIKNEIDYYENLTEKTHIVEYVDGKRVETDVVVLKNLYRAICLSYQVFGNNQQPDFTFDAEHDVMINGVQSVENDNVAYFYEIYLKNNPEIKVSAGGDLFEIYRKAFGSDATFMFSFNKEVSDVPVLNTQVAYYLFHYFFISSSDEIGQTGRTYYDSYLAGYSSMLEEAEMLILRSEPYYSTHYSEYKEAYTAEANYANIALVVAIVISVFAVLLTPRYLFKDGKTVGYKLMGLGVVSLYGEGNNWYVPLIKTLIDCIGFIPVAFILYLFPPFNGGYDAMYTPISVDGKISFAWIILIVGIIGAAVNLFGLFTAKRQNLLNIIFREVVVDSRRIDDGEAEETNQGREY